MKPRIFICLLLSTALISCTPEVPDAKKAESFINTFLKKTGNGNFENLSDYYSEEMKFGESEDVRKEKMSRLFRILGPIQEYELMELKIDRDGEYPTVILNYRVFHRSVTTRESYTVKLERKEYKIVRQNVESLKE